MITEHNDERIVASHETPAEKEIENTLRPKKIQDYIGQEKVKTNLSIFIEAAKKRNESLEHILLYGNPGLGKTTLAHIIANEMGGSIRVTSGPAIEKSGDLAAILTNLKQGDVLFIDEIHRLNKNIEEILYPAMEDYALDIIIGKGPSARTLRLDLPRFTLIGATTKMSSLSSPLRDRFGATFQLDFYTDNELAHIIRRSAIILNTQLDEDASLLIATRCRKTPRIANRLLKRIRDYALVKSDGIITSDITKDALALMDIDELGLDATDRKILMSIISTFKGGPVGLGTLAAATAEEEETIEDVYEPYLLQLGFLERTPKGRKVTALAYQHLNLTPPTLI
ncbi:Holliday junction branch migration DNA helicase RuvB [Candidatus Falkowbacteria bacterium]|nr:Holliday junction branch migration DNA helicase RuvB [Candidatus Falkowbacteria bacterium]